MIRFGLGMKKFIITFLVLLFLVAGGVGWWVMLHRFDSLVVQAIEEGGSEAFGTPVTVGAVRTRWAAGALEIEDLAVANPPGYERPHVFTFGTIEAAVDFETMEVARVVLDNAQFYIEERDGTTNVQEIRKSLEKGMPTDPGDKYSREEGIVIQRFLMRSSKATFESATLNRISEVEIDNIEMRDLRGTGEAIAGQIARRVVDEVANEAAQEMLKAQAQKHLEDVEDKVGEKLRELLGGDDSDEG